MNPLPQIAVILLNWNNAPDTLECLASVYASKQVDFQVYIADNGSVDGSLEILQAAYPQAIYVENKENLGFAEGNNRAIVQAMANGADFLFLLNNDATIHPDTLALLSQEALKHPKAAALGPKIYLYDRPTTIWYGGGEWDASEASFFHRHAHIDEWECEKETTQITGYVCGCALFVRREAIEQVGLMDKRFFLNWEEIDWCFRFKKKGYLCLYVPEAKAWHKVSSSFIGGKRGPMWLYFYWRNRLLWMERNISKKEFFFLFRKVIFPQIQQLILRLKSPEKEEKKKAKASLQGVLHYFLRRFGPPPKSLLKN